jgi:hypothetical protein
VHQEIAVPVVVACLISLPRPENGPDDSENGEMEGDPYTPLACHRRNREGCAVVEARGPFRTRGGKLALVVTGNDFPRGVRVRYARAPQARQIVKQLRYCPECRHGLRRLTPREFRASFPLSPLL